MLVINMQTLHVYIYIYKIESKDYTLDTLTTE